jgi:hypothetical protein
LPNPHIQSRLQAGAPVACSNFSVGSAWIRPDNGWFKTPLASHATRRYFHFMSVVEIAAKLPERADEVEFLIECATAMFLEMERQEAT